MSSSALRWRPRRTRERTRGDRLTAPDRLAVVLPARNEEELLPAALSSIRTAVRALVAAEQVEVSVTVVLDSCTDGSEKTAARIQGLWMPELDLRIVSGSFGTVGAARAAGISAQRPQPGLWIANTDADTVVPHHWLVRQHALASAGYGFVLGTVVPDPADLTAGELEAWQRLHSLGRATPIFTEPTWDSALRPTAGPEDSRRWHPMRTCTWRHGSRRPEPHGLPPTPSGWSPPDAATGGRPRDFPGSCASCCRAEQRRAGRPVLVTAAADG
ncbi:glycosyltransferase family A protein [Arthrobacter sp. ATA002]|uniref:glycosyltransferase family 2 protein n=1 Tax=Arthrobacter sp. ATA002 TaxID=2991715 RepID=UPI0022A784AF|nr:glycosyltransferase family A protein [Arthrobacter sp. ATA002]WAP51949.1 glycosyltransferase family A protein [Arthrobacter sp. ATA002]